MECGTPGGVLMSLLDVRSSEDRELLKAVSLVGDGFGRVETLEVGERVDVVVGGEVLRADDLEPLHYEPGYLDATM